VNKKRLLEQLTFLETHWKFNDHIFKSRAYKKAIWVVNLAKTEDDIYESKMIGKSMKEKIKSFFENGYLEDYEELRADKMFKAYHELGGIWGVGPKKVRELIQKNIYTIEDIKNNLDEAKLNKNQMIGLKYIDELSKPIPRTDINKIKKNFQKLFSKKKINMDILGSYRRKKKFSRDIDVILWRDDNKIKNVIDDVANILEEYELIDILTKGKKKMSVIYRIDGKIRKFDFIVVSLIELPTSKLYFTGSALFNVCMRLHAISLGYKLSDKGLFKKNKRIKVKNEKDIFNKLNTKYIKPENRNNCLF